DVGGDQLADEDRGRFAFLQSSNMLWALGDPARAKELIDEPSAATTARIYIDAFLTVYWFAMDQPESALVASKSLALEDLPVVGAEITLARGLVGAGARAPSA